MCVCVCVCVSVCVYITQSNYRSLTIELHTCTLWRCWLPAAFVVACDGIDSDQFPCWVAHKFGLASLVVTIIRHGAIIKP